MYRIHIAQNNDDEFIPASHLLKKWAKITLQACIDRAEVNIRIVSPDEIMHLNATYRHKKKPTNVLSFPLHLPADIQKSEPILGDIYICAAVVNQEACEQKKSKLAHWAHMIIHGCLHLLGHDHEQEHDAIIMERLEIKLLAKVGFSNPYELN